ncbi:hypothetical protein KKA47_00820 [bacterium]|nr:hypothetical protein [bacterium]
MRRYITYTETWSLDGFEVLDLTKDTILEIGPGRGDFLFYLAKANPDKNIIAIEAKLWRFKKLKTRTALRKLQNVFLIKDYAQNILNHVNTRCVSNVHIQFPDPWPKRRHGHNRLIQKDFLDKLSQIICDDAKLSFVTDSEEYAEYAATVIAEVAHFKSIYDPVIQKNPEEIFTTYFYDKWKRQGKSFYLQEYLLK